MPQTDVTVEYVHQTDAAILVSTDGKDRIWLPKAACEFDPEPDDLEEGDSVNITLSEKLAQEKGLI